MNESNEITYNDLLDYIQNEKEAIQILTDIVNGYYTPENFRLDIVDYIRENNRNDSSMLHLQ